MRPTLSRLISILHRSDVPKRFQERIIPRPAHPSKRPTTQTLIDHLNARKEECTRAYLAAQQKAEGIGALKVDAKPWPENLRIEPVIKRDAFAKITKEARMQLKEALKER